MPPLILKKEFEFIESAQPITDPISKFGGQPVWLNTPHWPLDPYSMQPMLFMGQVVLDVELFPDAPGLMAYLFFGDALEPIAGSAMAVVLQNAQTAAFNTQLDAAITLVPQATGPTIFELTEDRAMEHKTYHLSFCAVKQEAAVPLQERYVYGDLDYEKGYQFSNSALAGNKMGGQPMYVEKMDPAPAYFSDPTWQHLLQLAPKKGYVGDRGTNFYPFHMDLYGFGLVNFFVSKDYKLAQACTQAP